MLAIMLALALAQAASSPPQPIATPSPQPTPPATTVDALNMPRIATAERLIVDHQPDQALAVIDTALAAYEADHATEKRRLYCGMSMTETLLYLGMAARDKESAVALGPGYCTALYLRGFALIDLGRPAEARAVYEKVVALAPMHAHFLTELGQLSRLDKDWPKMLSTCETASGAAALADPAIKPREQGFALRCQGYALVEEHKLEEAEKRYRDALAIDPDDAKAKGELAYIAEQRRKP